MRLSSSEVRKIKKLASGLRALEEEQLRQAGAGKLDARLLSLTPADKVRYIRRLREEMRDRSLRDFYFFAKYVYGNKDMTPHAHRELCDFAQKKGKRKLILMPRGSLKSSVVTEAYSLWRLCRNPNLRILITNEDHGRAKAFLKAVRDCIERNQKFRYLFGALDANKNRDVWTDTGFNIATRTVRTKEASMECLGTESTKVGMHYDLIINDDLVSDKNTRTQGQIEKVVQFYKLSLSLLDPGKELIIIGTRWHFADLYGYLIAGDEERARKGRKPRWKKLIRKAVEDDGSILWPERLSRAVLSEKREDMGPYHFNCQYQNDPTGGEHQVFKKEWLRFYEEMPEEPLDFTVVLDPSLGKTNTSDYSAITVVARSATHKRYVDKVIRGRWNPTKSLKMLIAARQWVIHNYKIEPRVGIETVAFQWVMADNLREMQTRGVAPRFRLYELQRTTETTKELQIRKLVPYFEQGLFHLRGQSVENCSEGAQLLISEYLQFPVGRYDDILDTLAYHEEMARIPQIRRDNRKEDTLLQKVLKDAKRRGRGRKARVVGSRFRGARSSWRTSTTSELSTRMRSKRGSPA